MTRKRVCSLFRRAGEDMEKKNAYFTVEAALVLPIVIAALLFVIYMMLFQYDRCLLEQDMGAIALWGALVDASDAEDMERKTQGRLGELYREKYVSREGRRPAYISGAGMEYLERGECVGDGSGLQL